MLIIKAVHQGVFPAEANSRTAMADDHVKTALSPGHFVLIPVVMKDAPIIAKGFTIGNDVVGSRSVAEDSFDDGRSFIAVGVPCHDQVHSRSLEEWHARKKRQFASDLEARKKEQRDEAAVKARALRQACQASVALAA